MKQQIRRILIEQIEHKEKNLFKFFCKTLFERKFKITLEVNEKIPARSWSAVDDAYEMGDYITDFEYFAHPLLIRLTKKSKTLTVYFPYITNEQDFTEPVFFDGLDEFDKEVENRIHNLATQCGIYLHDVTIDKCPPNFDWNHMKDEDDIYVISKEGEEYGTI